MKNGKNERKVNWEVRAKVMDANLILEICSKGDNQFGFYY